MPRPMKGWYTMVDRTGEGGVELWFDGGPQVMFEQGETEAMVPEEFVRWWYGHGKGGVWALTEGGERDFVNRYGIRDASPQLLSEIGAHIGDCSPIVRDEAAVEGWDTRTVRAQDTPVRAVMIGLNRGDYEHLGAARRVAAESGRGR